MRPTQKSNNRSRGRGNRKSGNGGNNVNRVYDSAGPEGKVRGTPQQIIEKYLTLARDAQTSGDRVAAENFLQHAEHYQRILITANAAQEQVRRDQPDYQQDSPGDDNQSEPPAQQDHAARHEKPARDVGGMATIDPDENEPSLLVDVDTAPRETPEAPAAAKPEAKPRRRAPVASRLEPSATVKDDQSPLVQTDDAEKPKPRKTGDGRRRRVKVPVEEQVATAPDGDAPTDAQAEG